MDYNTLRFEDLSTRNIAHIANPNTNGIVPHVPRFIPVRAGARVPDSDIECFFVFQRSLQWSLSTKENACSKLPKVKVKVSSFIEVPNVRLAAPEKLC